MKTKLALILSLVAFFVNALPLEHFSGSGDSLLAQQKFDTKAPVTTTPENPNPAGSTANEPSSFIDYVVAANGMTSLSVDKASDYYIVQLEDAKSPSRIKYGECVTLKTADGKTPLYAKFTQGSHCFTYQDNYCKMSQVPIPLPSPGNLMIPNVLKLGSILGGSFSCEKGNIPIKYLTNPGKIFGAGSLTDPNSDAGKIQAVPNDLLGIA